MRSIKNYLAKRLYEGYRKKILAGANIIDQPALKEHGAVAYSAEETISFDTTYNVYGTDTLPAFIGEFSGEFRYDGAFYTVLDNAYLIGRHATAVLENKVVLDSILGSKGYLSFRSDIRKLRFAPLLRTEAEFEMAISLVNCLNDNYYHWVTEALPLLEALFVYEASNDCRGTVKVIVNSPAAPFVYEWLSLFGIDESRIVPWDIGKARVGHLLMPSLRYYRLPDRSGLWAKHLYPDAAFDFLRRIALSGKAAPSARNKKLYLSRERGNRRVLNEAELTDFLERNGFEKCVAEDLSVASQIEVFRHASHIVAPHGAGMVNMLFGEQQNLIELFPENRNFNFTYQFYEISAYCRNIHSLLVCKADKDQNIWVDIKRLSELLGIAATH